MYVASQISNSLELCSVCIPSTYASFFSFSVTNPLAGHVTAVICVACATFIAVGGLRAIVSIGIVTSFLAVAGTALPSGLALLPMGFKKMWEIASHGGRLVFYE